MSVRHVKRFSWDPSVTVFKRTTSTLTYSMLRWRTALLARAWFQQSGIHFREILQPHRLRHQPTNSLFTSHKSR
ncbi:hypothetical protein FJTKL_02040 [Diaporthe vaccinii]|uniref:Uncharacterized protein n=1 Tax=Diaporthe vaccinii TaxID=105482 RepID=A0ABR4DZA8_9PEZI